jgi:hypothetical protein
MYKYTYIESGIFIQKSQRAATSTYTFRLRQTCDLLLLCFCNEEWLELSEAPLCNELSNVWNFILVRRHELEVELVVFSHCIPKY